MKSTLIAAGLSLALHAMGLFVLLREAAPVVVPVAVPEKPVEMEVMRLAGLISPAARKSPAPVENPFMPSEVEAPDTARPVRRASARPADEGAGRANGGASLDSARDERGESASGRPAAEGAGSANDEASLDTVRDERGQPAQGSGPAAQEERGAPLDTTALSRRLQQVALRCYPAAARRFRQTGEAEIRFCLDAAGALRERTIVRTSGSELLDHAANDCVVPGAAPFGPETFGRCFTVPVRFSP